MPYAVFNNSKVSCVLCKREVSYKQLTNHYNSCVKSTSKSKPKPKTIKCPHCNKNIRNKNLHFDNCRSNPNWVNKSHIWTEERKLKHSISMLKAVKNNPDSYSKNNVCGRVKMIEYKPGVNLKGTWEVRVAQWLDSQNIRWENEANPQPYFWDDKWKLYFPDFYLPDYECYIEVKGYRTDRDIAKWNYFKFDLLIFEKEVIDKLDDISIEYALENFKWD